MSLRLPTHMLVSALVRQVNDAGGFAVVRAKGDAQAGAVLLLCAERGTQPRALERGIGPDGRVQLMPSGPAEGGESALDEYWRRRRSRDPDLWVIELDIVGAERFAAETMLVD